MKKLVLITILSLYLPAVYAQTDLEYYAGISTGDTKTSEPIVSGSEKNDNYKLFAGVNLKKNIDLEFHYAGKVLEMDFDDGTSTEISTYGVASVYQMPQEWLIPFIKIGYHKWELESDRVADSAGYNVFFGIGATKKMAKGVSFRVEAENFKYDANSVKYYSIGLQKKF